MEEQQKRYIINLDTGAKMTISAYSKKDAINRMKTMFGVQATFIGELNETY